MVDVAIPAPGGRFAQQAGEAATGVACRGFGASSHGRPILLDVLSDLIRGFRTSQQIALGEGAALATQHGELALGLHTLGGDVQPQAAAECDDGLHDRFGFGVIAHIADETLRSILILSKGNLRR